jgi:dihydroflavonol-4-reductase
MRSFIMSRTSFVTGSTGFLGNNLIRELSERNWAITALYVPSADLKYLSKYDINKVCGNLGDYDFLCDAIPEGTDAVFHLAANTSAWSKNDAQQYADNVIGTRNIVNASIKRKVKKFVYTSSISAFGYHPDRRIDENTVSNALNCRMNYNMTKFLAENEVKSAVKMGLDAVILNPCNIIGPYDVNNWTKQFLRPVYENRLSAIPPGKAMWCHVKDIVEAHINAVDMGVSGENYLLGGVEAGFLDVVNEIEKLLGKKLSVKVQPRWVMKMLVYILAVKSAFDGKEPLLTEEKYKRAVGYIRCDFNKAKRTLGYRTTSLDVMIKDSYGWLKSENLL